ncbi:acid phosphatase [Galdieria sulphuraria]|uniref:Inositol hexakisphosphate and diphosphoinositol-pentakisphosphate kinase n=1 Tax=Galdieria sulphuraria TaxID=130081 RepID=M2X3S9_GALSU|nr:acid phosphatase [Galdieria sulphuraria]EME31080.1 acid phosphatase [Galdieria sulphuraria]|eukprot:XP_005707600.1 acid phosphatase [Galdieria sulphuraria]
MEQERSESQTFQAKMLHDLPESLSVDRQQQNITAAQEKQLNRDRLCTVGICAMEKKVKSAAMQEMIHSILVYSNNLLRIIVFPLESIFNSSVEEWPVVDVLISFYSVGFPLDKVLQYVELRQPQCVNDIAFQKILLDRRLVFCVLKNVGVSLPPHVFVNRDSASRKQELCACLAQVTWKKSTLEKSVQSLQNAQNFYQAGETIFVGSHTLHMPFVEKPACADRHDIYIYYPLSMGGGVRRLFRKTADRSSEYYIPREDEKCGDVAHVRLDGSYVYESFLEADIQQDVKVYCVGPHYAYGELRKSPVVDGVVERLSDGRERRIATILSTDESNAATAIVSGFRQFVCGFDIIRCKNRFFVIDVNGWSFVKGNEEYYRQAGRYLATHILFLWSKPNC